MSSDTGRVIPPTYWFEGATIGAAVLGTTGVFLAAAACSFDESGTPCGTDVYVTSAVLSGVAGAGLGALAGGLFDAPHARPLRGHPVRTAILGALAGAFWSVGFLCEGLAHGCGDAEPVFGISSTLAGAVAGWLVAR